MPSLEFPSDHAMVLAVFEWRRRLPAEHVAARDSGGGSGGGSGDRPAPRRSDV